MKAKLLSSITKISKESPSKMAVSGSGLKLTYGELERWSEAQACVLQGLVGNVPTVISVLMPSGPELVSALSACFKSGNIYLPLNMEFSEDRILETIEKMDSTVICTNEASFGMVQRTIESRKQSIKFIVKVGFDGQIEVFDEAFNLIELTGISKVRNDSYDEKSDAYIIFTSGTTGIGKVVVGNLAGINNFIEWQTAEFSFDSNCRVGQICEPTFDAYFRDVFLPLTCGGELFIPDKEVKRNMGELVHWLQKNEINVIHTVPSIFRLLLEEISVNRRDSQLFSIQKVFLAGEPIYAEDVRNFYSLIGSAEFINLYGTTETTMAKTFHRMTEDEGLGDGIVSVGKPIDQAAIAIINNGRICRPGEIGEVFIKSPFCTNGYFRDEELTNSVFIQNPLHDKQPDIVYKTGDRGRYLKDHSIEILGRVDEQVKINGKRIDLKETEILISKATGVKDVLLKLQKEPGKDDELVCYFKSDMDISTFQNHVHNELRDYVRPTHYQTIDAIPFTLNGKIDKNALPKVETVDGQEKKSEFNNQLLCELRDIWNTILLKEVFQTDVPFFKVGGNSIKAIQLISRIQRQFSIKMSIADIFSHQTIAQQAGFISKSKGQVNKDKIEPIEEQDHYSASHAQNRLMLSSQIDKSDRLNMFQVYCLKGKIDLDTLQECFNQSILKHESLRTAFITHGGQFRQKVISLEKINFKIVVEELEQFNHQELEKSLLKFVQKPFDLKSELLLRVLCIKVPHLNQVWACINMHHIVSDDWSFELLLKEVTTMYSLLSKGMDYDFEEPSIQYKDYTVWQNKILNQSLLKSQKFWKEQIAKIHHSSKIPSDYVPNSDARISKSNVKELELSSQVSGNLLQVAEKLNVTPFMLTLTLLEVMLSKLVDTSNPIVCVTVTDRSNSQLENQIGFYVNLIPIMVEIQDNVSFTSYMNKLNKHWSEVMSHKSYPFDKIVMDVKSVLGENHSNLFNVGFTWHEDTLQNHEQIDLEFTVQDYSLDYFEARWDIWFHAYQNEKNQIIIRCYYDTGLYTEESIHWIMDILDKMATGLGTNPHQLLREVTLINPGISTS